MNTSTIKTNAAREAGQRTQITVRDRTGNIISPGDPDYDMMKAKQESRERRACAHIGLLAHPAPSTYNRARAICSCRHHAFPCAKCEALKPSESTAEGTRIDYDGTIYTVTGKSYEYHAGRDEEITIVTLADDEGNECRATLDDLKGCQRWASTPNPAALRAAQDEALGLRIALVDAKKQIASLRAERTAYQTAARAWKDEVTALRAALEPFAELATSAKCDEMPEHAARTFVITAASMLAARAALAGKGDK